MKNETANFHFLGVGRVRHARHGEVLAGGDGLQHGDIITYCAVVYCRALWQKLADFREMKQNESYLYRDRKLN